MTKAEAQGILIRAFVAAEELPDDIKAVLQWLINKSSTADARYCT